MPYTINLNERIVYIYEGVEVAALQNETTESGAVEMTSMVTNTYADFNENHFFKYYFQI